MPERVQKLLAASGVGSRRQVEQWISEGRVLINGSPAVPGQKITGREVVVVDGQRVSLAAAQSRPVACIIYHKPVGEVCTRSDPEGRPTIFERLPEPPAGRWVSVGRLDVMTSGLLLLTADGELANRLMHPSGGFVREYAVRVDGQPDEATLGHLRSGIDLDDGPGRFDTIGPARGEGRNTWFNVTVREGRNRLVRRLWEAAGFPVSRLVRVRFGGLRLPPDLRPGQSVELTGQPLRQLYRSAGLGEPGELRRRPVPRMPGNRR
ncbi:MAG: rRNA pseudouridine synthase [Chromatiales bacterium]|nr:rRNA pseudouridine synthase [Chromatiales bacterium]